MFLSGELREFIGKNKLSDAAFTTGRSPQTPHADNKVEIVIHVDADLK